MQTKLANLLKLQTLSENERDVIKGCLLGDGTLTSSGKNYRLRIEHKMLHAEYVYWKHSLLKRITITEPRRVLRHNSLRFGTVGHPEITLMREEWYEGSLKTIPRKLRLKNLSIAIWFMDDGCKHRDTVDFSIHNFRFEDADRLRSILASKGILTTINSDSKGKRLYVKKESYTAFKKLVKPYIVKCMAYKLP